jgi:predicted nucleotide-binding protein
MARKVQAAVPESKPELTVTRAEAEKKIADRIKLGEEINIKQISSVALLEAVQQEYYRWDSYNHELLGRLFTPDKFAEEYAFFGIMVSSGPQPLSEEIKELREKIVEKVHRLTSILERLPLIPVQSGLADVATTKSGRLSESRRVFIVHGHDIGVRESVARFLERIELEVIILHEQAGKSRTIVEKLEEHSDVDFAVILLTPDDLGTSKVDQANLKPRARQNVILELGYFVGKLGRRRVCALYADGVELPSDVMGVQYVQIRTGWEIELARELKAAEFPVDMNKLF